PCGARPLTRIEILRREDRWILAAVAPLAIRERVDAKVEEQRQLIALPIELRPGRARSRRRGHSWPPWERTRGEGRRADSKKRAPLHDDPYLTRRSRCSSSSPPAGCRRRRDGVHHDRSTNLPAFARRDRGQRLPRSTPASVWLASQPRRPRAVLRAR